MTATPGTGAAGTNASTGSETPPNETTTLLPKDVDTEQQYNSNSGTDDDRSPVGRIAVEFWVLFKTSVPVILAYALQNSLQTLSVVIVGRLSPEALSVAAFCYMFAMATGWLYVSHAYKDVCHC